MQKLCRISRAAGVLLALFYASYTTAQPQNVGNQCTASNLNENNFNAIKVGQSFSEVLSIIKCHPMTGYKQGEYYTKTIDSRGQRYTMVSWQNLADGPMSGMRTISVRFNKEATTVTADKNGDFKDGSGF